MTIFGKMQRHHLRIEEHVRKIVEERQASVLFGALTASNANLGSEESRIELNQPTLIWKAPARGSSSRSNELRAIFIHGSFTFKQTDLVDVRATLAVYSIKKPDLDCFTLTLLDSMHFDTEKVPQRPFHPIFHAQRGLLKSGHSTDKLAELVSSVSRVAAERISFAEPECVGCPQVRLPTPQMDYISLLLAVVGDFFGEAQPRNQVRTGFKELLKHIRNSDNVARQAIQAKLLAQRWSGLNPSGFCSACWYEYE